MIRSVLNTAIREPLFHFLALALGLFLLYGTLSGDDDAERGKTIFVTRDDLLTFMQYRAKAFDAAHFGEMVDGMTVEDRIQVINSYVREEALYREAKALGLDRNDYVARRRLVQQLEFITQGFVDDGVELTEKEISAYYQGRQDEYSEPENITFTHVFYSYDRRGMEKAEAHAIRKLEELNTARVQFHEAVAHGDRALYHVNYVESPLDLVASHFGKEMADALFVLEPDATKWRGPFRSPYGAHLVLVTEREAAYMPPLDEIRARVASDILAAKQVEEANAVIESIVAAYDVTIAEDVSAAPLRTVQSAKQGMRP